MTPAPGLANSGTVWLTHGMNTAFFTPSLATGKPFAGLLAGVCGARSFLTLPLLLPTGCRA